MGKKSGNKDAILKEVKDANKKGKKIDMDHLVKKGYDKKAVNKLINNKTLRLVGTALLLA